MTAIWRIGVVGRTHLGATSISLEMWNDWAAFDASLSSKSVKPSPPGSVIACLLEGSQEPVSSGLRVFELQRIRVNNGSAQRAATQILDHHFRVFRQAGASQLSLFEAVHGDDLPVLLLLLAWPNAGAASEAILALETDAGMVDDLACQRAGSRRPAIAETVRYFANCCVVEMQ
jgi:hypothetical protein